MANIQPPPIQPRTALWGLGFALEKVSLRFKSIYESIRDTWLLGPYLAWPFYYLYLFFNEAKQKSWEADDKLVEIATWVNGIINGTVIRDILDFLSYNYTRLRNDPIGLIRDILSYVSYEFTLIRIDPYNWVKNKVLAVWPIVYDLIYGTRNWLLNVLGQNFPLLYQLFVNPFGTLRNWILSLFYWAREFNSNVIQSIISFISQRAWWFSGFITAPVSTLINLIKQQNFSLGQFLDNPIQWVKYRIMDFFGIPYGQEYNVVSELIKKAMLILAINQGGILILLEKHLCDIIVYFL